MREIAEQNQRFRNPAGTHGRNAPCTILERCPSARQRRALQPPDGARLFFNSQVVPGAGATSEHRNLLSLRSVTRHLRAPPTERHDCPDPFDNSERPRALEEAVHRSKRARGGEAEHEPRAPSFERIAQQHRGDRKETKERQRIHVRHPTASSDNKIFPECCQQDMRPFQLPGALWPSPAFRMEFLCISALSLVAPVTAIGWRERVGTQGDGAVFRVPRPI